MDKCRVTVAAEGDNLKNGLAFSGTVAAAVQIVGILERLDFRQRHICLNQALALLKANGATIRIEDWSH